MEGLAAKRFDSLDEQLQGGRNELLALWQVVFEAWFNGALAAYKAGDLQDSYQQCKRALELSPTHSDAIELSAKLKEVFLVA